MNRCLKFWPASLLLCLLSSLADIGSAQDTVPKGPKGGPMQLSADVTAGRASVDSKWLNYEEVSGLAIAEGDIVLGTLAEMRGAPAKKNGLRSSVVVRGGQFRWPGGLVPYVIDESGSRNPSMALVARQAIRHWEEKTSYRFVERTTQRNYIKFNAQDSGCYSYIGMRGGEQPINLDRGCERGQAIHEIGHAIGLFHEQSRSDRDDFIRVQLANVQDGYASQFEVAGASGEDMGFYDYSSVMHYVPRAFTANGQDTILTVPAGIPIGQRSELSESDIAVAERLNGATGRLFVINTNPSGLVANVDGTNCQTPCRFTWANGSGHSVRVESPQRVGGEQFYFARWNDGGEISHNITADSGRPVLSANFSLIPSTGGGGGGAEKPDLVVAGFQTALQATAGEKIPITQMTVRNVGTAPSGPFRVTFYVSANQTINTADVSTGWYCDFEGLAPGEAKGCGGEIEIPSGIPAGTYYIGALADSAGAIAESSEINNGTENQSGPTRITSGSSAKPDLVIESFSTAAEAVAGGRVPGMSMSVRNRGLQDAGKFRVGFYISRSQNVSASDVFTRWACTEDEGLAPDDTSSCSGEIGIPADLQPGSYYLIAVVDDLGQVDEAEESNNARVSDRGAVVVGQIVVTGPDLVATSFTAPVSGISGQEISGMRAIIKNQGNQRAGAFRIGFYLADRLPVTTSSRFTGWSCDVEALDPGQTFACFGNIGIPEGTAAGTYQLAVIADDRQTVQETAESNNARTNDSGQISVTPAAQADLVIAAFKAATTGTPGERISGMESTVRNTGNAKSGAFRIGFYISRDAVITTDDLFTGWSCISEEGLTPGETWGCSGQIGIPNIAPGAYYLGAIVDDLSEIAERDENNNARSNENGVSTLVSAPRADLTVLSFSAATVGSPGLNAPGMEAVISNLGAAPAGPFRIGFYISLDAAISTNDYFTGWSCRVESLDVSGTFRCSGDFGVPGDVPPGNYYFGVIVDDLDEVTEANEGNNGRPNQRGITAVR